MDGKWDLKPIDYIVLILIILTLFVGVFTVVNWVISKIF